MESSSLMLKYSDWRIARHFTMNALSRKQVRQIFDWLKVGDEVGAREAT